MSNTAVNPSNANAELAALRKAKEDVDVYLLKCCDIANKMTLAKHELNNAEAEADMLFDTEGSGNTREPWVYRKTKDQRDRAVSLRVEYDEARVQLNIREREATLREQELDVRLLELSQCLKSS